MHIFGGIVYNFYKDFQSFSDSCKNCPNTTKTLATSYVESVTFHFTP